jgi:hypothetical protein
MIIRGNEPIVIVRSTENGNDAYGNPTYGKQEILIRDGLFAFGSGDEPVDATRNAIDAALTLYLPKGTVVEEEDVFIIREVEWVKDGDPEVWEQLWSGFDVGVVVQVRKRRG